MTTRRVHILRALKPLYPDGSKLPALGALLGEDQKAINGCVWYQLSWLIKKGFVVADGMRRHRVYRLTKAGVQYLEDIDVGRIDASVRGPGHKSNRGKVDHVVIRSSAKAGQAPVGPISSVFDLGRYL